MHDHFVTFGNRVQCDGRSVLQPGSGAVLGSDEFPARWVANCLLEQTALESGIPMSPSRAPGSSVFARVFQSFVDELASPGFPRRGIRLTREAVSEAEGYAVRRREWPCHQGMGTRALSSPEARMIGKWARRWRWTWTSESVIETSAGVSMRSRKMWRAWASA
jgi:hypothetical protein